MTANALPSVTDILKGMPHAHRGRAGHLHQRGITEGMLRAADEIEGLLNGSLGSLQQVTDLPVLIGAWISATREAAGEERGEE